MSVTAVVKRSRCFWHDNNSICPVCGYDIPVDNEHIKEAFARCNDCGATCHENMKTSKVSLYFPSEDKDWIYSVINISVQLQFWCIYFKSLCIITINKQYSLLRKRVVRKIFIVAC